MPGPLNPFTTETRFWGQNYLDLVWGGVNPKSLEARQFLHDSRRVPRPSDFACGSSLFSPNQFSGEVLSSQIEKTS